MIRIALVALALGSLPFLGTAPAPVEPSPTTAPEPTVEPPAAPAPFHCQVPCGIYGDRMRMDGLFEDVSTIKKAMMEIAKIEEAGGKPANQLVRWVLTKDEHAAKVQEQIASYWLAQRIKVPEADVTNARRKYMRQLELLHRVTVAAMKCKQTTDTKNADAVRVHAVEFGKSYFSEEDLQHIRVHRAEQN